MLQVTVPGTEYYDEVNEEFVETKDQTLQLEHSLISISKWESKWKKPFLSRENRTLEESIDYVRCMTLTQNVNPLVYRSITQDIFDQIDAYIEDPMTATWFSNRKRGKANSETITSELIYYWMVTFNIPFECQKWHLNRLMTLIQVCSIKNEPENKMSKRQILASNRALNDARRRSLRTSG